MSECRFIASIILFGTVLSALQELHIIQQNVNCLWLCVGVTSCHCSDVGACASCARARTHTHTHVPMSISSCNQIVVISRKNTANPAGI